MNALLASGNPMSHVVAHNLITAEDGTVLLDNHMVMQIAATFLLIVLLTSAFRSVARRSSGDIEGLVPKGAGNFFESICNYLRNEVARPSLGEYTDRFIPYIWTVFFFILFSNLLGLLPIDATLGLFMDHPPHLGGTSTGNIWVTGTLAACTMFMMVFNGLRLGKTHYLAHFCPGPIWLAPLLIPVEIIGLGAKIFALTVRLFANMMAGHILLAVLIGFGTVGIGVAFPAVLGATAISCLELFVAFLQAFIFTFLTCLFIGQSVVFHHDDHGHEAGGAH